MSQHVKYALYMQTFMIELIEILYFFQETVCDVKLTCLNHIL